jgi:hypothetical protein
MIKWMTWRNRDSDCLSALSGLRLKLWLAGTSLTTTSDRWLATLSPRHSCTTHGFRASSHSSRGHGIKYDSLSLPKVLPYIKSHVYNLFTGLTSVYI